MRTLVDLSSFFAREAARITQVSVLSHDANRNNVMPGWFEHGHGMARNMSARRTIILVTLGGCLPAQLQVGAQSIRAAQSDEDSVCLVNDGDSLLNVNGSCKFPSLRLNVGHRGLFYSLMMIGAYETATFLPISWPWPACFDKVPLKKR
jgi:hypothetical protein